MALPNTLVNSNYTQKHIVDADKLMENFQYVLDQIGETPLKNLIIATGQSYNKLDAQQLLIAVIQLILAGQYFTDKSDSANSVILTPSVSSYANPANYVNNMEFLFSPAYTNTGGVTILFDGLDSDAYTKPLSDRAGNALVSAAIVAGRTYCAHYDSSRDSFILGSLRDSTSGSYAETALDFIDEVVTSLGITFSEVNTTQLAQAIAEYSLLTSYKDVSTSADLNNQIYRIKPYNEEGTSAVTVVEPFEYYNGMTVRFNPSFSNNSTTAYIMVDTLSAIPVVKMDGNAISANDIRQGIDVVARYLNGSFYLLSNQLNKLSLNSGSTVDTIESALTSSGTSLPTSLAVKNAITEVENKVSDVSKSFVASKAFCVVSGPAGSDDQTYISLDTDEVAISADVGLVYADYSYELTAETSVVDLTGITGDFKILYVKGVGLVCKEIANYTESFTAPATAGSNGDAYVYIDTFGRIHTYIYSTTETAWVPTNFVKVAFGSESSGTYTLAVPPLCGKYITETTVPTSSTTTTITHDMDSLCDVKLLLTCTIPDLAYTIGDTMLLSPFITSNQFLTVGSTNTTVAINTSGILLPNGNGTPTAIDSTRWKLTTEITRIF